MSDPYHAGERAIQEMAAERNKALLSSRVIASAIPKGAIPFVDQQPFCILGWRSGEGLIWASVLSGPPGFAQADETGKGLTFRLGERSDSLPETPPFSELGVGDHLGTLFIDLAKTRRRLRANGRVASRTRSDVTIAIEQAYPNCPKYIQRRNPEPQDWTDPKGISQGRALTVEVRRWITGADTFFVASAHPDGPVDTSHRGGKAGFVRLRDDRLVVPDYPGNSMFNTFGNFHLNPRAGLAFVDFETNRQLKLTGNVRLDFEAGDPEGVTGGTGRWWEFEPTAWIVEPLLTPLRWVFVDPSPFNP